VNGKVAVVLGAGPGLGAAIAQRFAHEGFAVGLMARREESLSAVQEEIEGAGGTALEVVGHEMNGMLWVELLERPRGQKDRD
jgi:short-subunit dehydrogenase